MGEQNDFIATELLGELKAENNRKDAIISKLIKTIVGVIILAFVIVAAVVGGFLWYLNQYDFSGTTTSNITQESTGVYSLIDSEGNVVSADLTPEEVAELMEMINSGNSQIDNPDDNN